jgi:hypothetical protein
MARFAIQQIRLNNVLYPGVTGYGIDPGDQVEAQASDGTVHNTAHHLLGAQPMADLSSLSIKSMMSALNGSLDLPLLQLDGTNGLEMFFAKGASNGPGYTAGTTHSRRQALRGSIYVSSIRWSRGSRAEMSLRAMFFSGDGNAASISSSSTVALPTLPVSDAAFGLESLTIAGTACPEVDDLELTIDPKFAHEFSYGLPYPTNLKGAGVTGQVDVTLSATVGNIESGVGTGSTSFVLKRFTHGGGFGTDSVTCTLNGAWSLESAADARVGGDATHRLTVRTRYDGTNRPLTWVTA